MLLVMGPNNFAGTFFVNDDAMLEFPVFSRTEELHLVEQYQHFGTWITRTGVHSVEPRYRAQKHLAIFC